MFVSTADPVLEPPIITVNTILSLLAVDYPPHKLACYVSDDGCSPLTLFSLIEASKFARIWVPFCKKHDIQDRAPFGYFSAGESTFPCDSPPEFFLEWTKVKVIFGLILINFNLYLRWQKLKCCCRSMHVYMSTICVIRVRTYKTIPICVCHHLQFAG